MAHLLAVLTGDPERIPCQVAKLRNQVRVGHPDEQLGLGHYADDRVLVAKRPASAPSHDVAQLAEGVRSPVLLALSREPGLRYEVQESDPFRFRSWVFAMDGEVEGFERIREPLVRSLPELLARQLKGTTDREHVFALLLKELKAQGRLDDPTLPAVDAARSLAFAVRALDALTREGGSNRLTPLAMAATNGRILVAARRGRPLSYALVEGFSSCEPCGLVADGDASPAAAASHRRCKAVALATEPLAGAGFLEVPDGSVVAVGRGLDIQISSI